MYAKIQTYMYTHVYTRRYNQTYMYTHICTRRCPLELDTLVQMHACTHAKFNPALRELLHSWTLREINNAGRPYTGVCMHVKRAR